jgi:hypothetical protein
VTKPDDDLAKLPQRCRCGGTGQMFAVYDTDARGVLLCAGWVAKCSICGASTLRRAKWRTAWADWLARRCPLTIQDKTQ